AAAASGPRAAASTSVASRVRTSREYAADETPRKGQARRRAVRITEGHDRPPDRRRARAARTVAPVRGARTAAADRRGRRRRGRLPALPTGGPDPAPASGPLHNSGLMLIPVHAPDVSRYELELAKQGERLAHHEPALLGMTHAELGARLAEQWSYPPLLVDAI